MRKAQRAGGSAGPVGPTPLSRSFATSPFLSTRRRTRRTPLGPYHFQGPLLQRSFSCRPKRDGRSELVPRPFQGPLQQRSFSCCAGARGGPRWSRTTFKVLCNIAVSLVAPARRRAPLIPRPFQGHFVTTQFLSTRRGPLVLSHIVGFATSQFLSPPQRYEIQEAMAGPCFCSQVPATPSGARSLQRQVAAFCAA